MTTTPIFNSIILLFVLTTTALLSCKPQTPPDPNEEELITTVLVSLRDSSGIEPNKSFLYRDTDGDGGAAPSVFDTIRVKSNKTYYADLFFLDESKQPSDTISKEIIEEANEHLVCYTATGVTMPIQILDKDANNLPLGLKSTWRPQSMASGALRIVLKHQPGNKNGSCEPGSSDVDLTFELRVE